ncbi:hypothetical protein HHI36_018117 [Cryptolaemus montrouzieri]|uniref:Uncharacterized protein n=1 Tax=Cryptolaemus montrouzieri TaxID=559131 RepID=A0ABD2NZB1_9CUCU
MVCHDITKETQINKSDVEPPDGLEFHVSLEGGDSETFSAGNDDSNSALKENNLEIEINELYHSDNADSTEYVVEKEKRHAGYHLPPSVHLARMLKRKSIRW